MVEASVGKTSGLRFMIDTAATCSVVDKKVIKALGLKQEPGESQILAFGQVAKANRFRIPMLQLGPVFATLHCLEADLAGRGIDGIIGLDLLRQQTQLASCETHEIIKRRTLTIDFTTHKLSFGLEKQLEHTVPLEASNPQIVVVAAIQGRRLLLAVDTGVNIMILFKESHMGWVETSLVIQRPSISFAGAISPGEDVVLPGVELGNSRWSSLNGVLMNLPDQATDGVLAIAQLGLKILHFDFERNLMSWRN